MIEIVSPVSGLRMEVHDIPDPVFADGLVGPGAAVLPRGGEQQAVAPLDGTLVKLHPHAYLVLGEHGYGVLVHLGIDTVHLGGVGFTPLVAEQASVAAGQPIVSWDPAQVESTGHSAVCAVVVLDCPLPAVPRSDPGSQVAVGEPLFALDPALAAPRRTP
jgi:sugar PTS system EIIA component